MIVTYPGVGPSVCDRIFRVTPGVVAGVVACADASVAMNPVTAQSAQDAIPAKSRRVSMTNLPVVPGSQVSGLPQCNRRLQLGAGRPRNCRTEMSLASGKAPSACGWGYFCPVVLINVFQRPQQCAAVAASRKE